MSEIEFRRFQKIANKILIGVTIIMIVSIGSAGLISWKNQAVIDYKVFLIKEDVDDLKEKVVYKEHFAPIIKRLEKAVEALEKE